MYEPIAGRFDGKALLVTGAGSGIGRASALRLAAEGGKVLAHDVNADGLAETAAIITAAGGTVETRVGDITTRDECFETVAEAVSSFGKLDVLVNVAGIAASHHFTDMSEAAYRRMVAVNQDAPFFFCQAAIPHLLESGGNIVNVASNAGLMGQAYTVAYSMTKGAVIQLTKSLAMEFMKTPLRVNGIAPGGIESSLTAGYQMPDDLDWDFVGRYAGFRGMGVPEDIAQLVSLLASADGINIHGSILSSDRGVTAG
jgi:meso-butanediol dehydrogenase/(S,S)-butanediol dehydrogenase/diacetyl reductase